LKEVRKSLIKQETEAEEAEKKKYLDLIKNDLEAILSERKKGDKDFLIHLMEKHLPVDAEKVDLCDE
jgi:hypothetical protein